MKTVTIQLSNALLDTFLSYCSSLGLQKIEVIDEITREDTAFGELMNTIDFTETVPMSAVKERLKAKMNAAK